MADVNTDIRKDVKEWMRKHTREKKQQNHQLGLDSTEELPEPDLYDEKWFKKQWAGPGLYGDETWNWFHHKGKDITLDLKLQTTLLKLCISYRILNTYTPSNSNTQLVAKQFYSFRNPTTKDILLPQHSPVVEFTRPAHLDCTVSHEEILGRLENMGFYEKCLDHLSQAKADELRVPRLLWHYRHLQKEDLRDFPCTDLITHRVRIASGTIPYAARLLKLL